MGKWHLIQNQQRLREIFKEPPLISYRKGKSLKDLLVGAKLSRSYNFQYDKVKGSCDVRRSFLTMFNNLKCYACRFHYKNFFYVSPLAGFFFSDKLPLQEFFLGNCHPTSSYLLWSVPYKWRCFLLVIGRGQSFLRLNGHQFQRYIFLLNEHWFLNNYPAEYVISSSNLLQKPCSF